MKEAARVAIVSICLGAIISVPTTTLASSLKHRPSGLHDLKAVLTGLKRRFGKNVIVTSGFRPRAGRSQHARCKAADIRIKGVKPSVIASYARKMRGIGGVGTYCRTSIVHVDVGPKRTWRHC